MFHIELAPAMGLFASPLMAQPDGFLFVPEGFQAHEGAEYARIADRMEQAVRRQVPYQSAALEFNKLFEPSSVSGIPIRSE